MVRVLVTYGEGSCTVEQCLPSWRKGCQGITGVGCKLKDAMKAFKSAYQFQVGVHPGWVQIVRVIPPSTRPIQQPATPACPIQQQATQQQQWVQSTLELEVHHVS